MNVINERAVIGDNQPPPHESFKLHIDELFETASGFLDGTGISNEEQAAAVAKLLEMARSSAKDAQEQRKREKAPHDAAAHAVQELWRPIISRAELTAATCKQALAPWLKLKDDEMRAVALAAAQEAENLAAAARALHDSAGTDLAAKDAAEQALKTASKAATAAAKADKAKPQATGGSRAVGLRTSYRAEVIDHRAFARWAWQNRLADLTGFLDFLAEKEVRASQAPLPGVTIHEERTAV